jgi:hypothetical protein
MEIITRGWDIGPGRAVDQEIARIEKGFEERTAENNPIVLEMIKFVKKNSENCIFWAYIPRAVYIRRGAIYMGYARFVKNMIYPRSIVIFLAMIAIDLTGVISNICEQSKKM